MGKEEEVGRENEWEGGRRRKKWVMKKKRLNRMNNFLKGGPQYWRLRMKREFSFNRFNEDKNYEVYNGDVDTKKWSKERWPQE